MKKRIRQIADCRAGYLFRGKVKQERSGAVRVIQIKDIDADFHVHLDNLVSVTIDRPEPHLTQQGDVLFLSRGHNLYAAVVPEVQPNTIATGYFYILRPHTDIILPEYLAWSLNRPEFRESVRPYHRGSHMPMVSRADLQDLRINLPPIECQRQIVALHELLQRERELMDQIHEKRCRLVQAASRKLMFEPSTERDV